MRIKHSPRDLSRGRLQWVAIIWTLINDLENKLDDEIIGNLENKNDIEIMKLLKKVVRKKKKNISGNFIH